MADLVTPTDTTRYLETPLSTSPGQPLRVAVYSRISQGIRSGAFASGTVLPRETELGASLGVSRTVVREALMLLEEDGLIVTKRGVGRFVSDSLPPQELDHLEPLDYLRGEPLQVELIEFSLQKVTDFVSAHLGLDGESEFWFRECLMLRNGQAVALVQEYLPDEQHLSGLSRAVSSQLRAAAAEPATLIHSLTARVGQVFQAGPCRIAANVAGRTRATQLGIKASDPVLVLTQAATIEGTPAHVSKVALAPAFGHVAATRVEAAAR